MTPPALPDGPETQIAIPAQSVWVSGKALLNSKAFWLSIASGGAELAGVLPPPFSTIAWGVNIVIRLFTNTPITSFLPKKQ